MKGKGKIKNFYFSFATPKCSTLLFCWRIKSKERKPEPEHEYLNLYVIRNILIPWIICCPCYYLRATTVATDYCC